MRRQRASFTPTRRVEAWTAFECQYGRGDDPPTVVIKAPGEVVVMGYGTERPATDAEIAAEQAARAEQAERLRQIEAFQSRPEWRLADDIRSRIEIMEYNNHPLDRLTLDEWRALRDKICGE